VAKRNHERARSARVPTGTGRDGSGRAPSRP
jgi:hypothetical protein